MECNGEISDTDSGIILHSGCDSPTSNVKDVTTHTRAMKLKNQSLQDRLQLCLLELKSLCIREAELTGRLPAEYPLLPGEKPPQVRRRIGAAFKLDDQNIPQGAEESELNSADTELALQLKIYEAARKLCHEANLSKAIKKSRLQQCKRAEKKLRQLQETTFQLRLERGRASTLPAFNNLHQEQGTSDDSSLSDLAVLDEELSSQPSTGLQEETASPGIHSASTPTPADSSCLSLSTPQDLLLSPSQPPHPRLEESVLSFNSSFDYEPPPIEHSPWTETSLDQPYQKTKKSRSSSKSSSPAQVLPPLEACLPAQMSHLRLSHTQSSSTPSTPEMRLHRNLSLRLSNTECSYDSTKDRGRTSRPRRRLTEYTAALPQAPGPRLTYGSQAGADDSHSDHSSSSYNSSPCHELPCDLSNQYQPSFRYQRASSPATGSASPLAFPCPVFYQNSRHQTSPSFHRSHYNEGIEYALDLDMSRRYYGQPAPCSPNIYDRWHSEAPVYSPMAQRLSPLDVRLPHSPSQWEYPQPCYSGLPRQVVNEELKSWHQRSQFRPPRPRSLDRQGAVRVKNPLNQGSPLLQNRKYQEQIIQRTGLQRIAGDSPVQWFVEDTSEIFSQV